MTTPLPETSPPRASSGIPGLDNILGGGFPKNRLYLIKGDPGVGKTTLALQFLLEGARIGESGLYITLSETRDELTEVARSHGWGDMDEITLFELTSIAEAVGSEMENTFFHPSEIELNRTTKALLDEVERVNPARVVFDSLSEMRMLGETPLRYRKQILELKQYFSGRKSTVLFLDDRSSSQDLQVESIAHGVVALLKSSPDYGVSRRQLIVEKVRGVGFREGHHDLILRKGGMIVFPRLVAAEHRSDYIREEFSGGITELDKLLGGGLTRGTSNMFMGPPGTGKSTLAIQFAVSAASRGEKALLFLFDETVETLLNRSSKLSLDISSYVESGLIEVRQIDPAEISPGEFVFRIREAISKENVRMIVIDSLNGYLNAMPQESYLTLQLHELLAFLNQQGVISIMVLAQRGLVGVMHSTVDLTYLADTVVLLRFFEYRGAVKQALSVIKKRSGNHERTIREITVGAGGIRVGYPLTNMHGVLGGSPTLEHNEMEGPPSAS